MHNIHVYCDGVQTINLKRGKFEETVQTTCTSSEEDKYVHVFRVSETYGRGSNPSTNKPIGSI